jgi:hypothetical protein
MSGVVPTGTPGANIRVGREDIDELSLAFVSPLRTEPC